VLRLLSELYPDDLPHHENWKAGQVHPAYLLVFASIDHLIPGARGGDWADLENMVTSCWPCNTGKADLLLDEIGKTLLTEDEVRSGWDGLSGSYTALWQAAGCPDFHSEWRKALLAGASPPL